MRRRDFIAMIGSAATASIAGPVPLGAQQAGNVPHIGFLVTNSLDSPETRRVIDAFRRGLRERGYVEGENIVIEYRGANGEYDRLPGLASELVGLKVDIIVAPSTPAVRAAQQATTTIPVVASSMQDRAFSAITTERADALLVGGGPMLFAQRRRIVELAAKRRLPTVFSAREFVELGGLMSYGPSSDDLFRRSAAFVDKILKGAPPGDLPVEQPTKFELVVNLKTAKALGLTIAQSILYRADEVIE
jgi:ABC-type uncharacterized transport system substrate-binding protein